MRLRTVKTLHLYLTRQVIASLLMTLAVFTFVFLLGNVLNEILGLLMKRQVSLGIVAAALGLLIPFVLVFALPMALLASTLLVFGRFSADQELTAARAGGISLVSLVTPIILLSLVLCGLSAYVNMEFGPRCRVAYKELLFKVGAEFAGAYLPEGVFIKEFKDRIIYIGKNDRGRLENVLVVWRENTNTTITLRAAQGLFRVDATNRVIEVELLNVTGFINSQERSIPTHASRYPLVLEFGGTADKTRKPAAISDYTFRQLRAELRELEGAMQGTMATGKLTREEFQKQQAQLQKQREEFVSPLRVQMHRQVAFSFACFGFALIGIPLGIRVHRRETSASFAVALVLVMIYYSFVVVAESLATRPELYPHLIVWIPNFIFQIVGAVLLWRANRGV